MVSGSQLCILSFHMHNTQYTMRSGTRTHVNTHIHKQIKLLNATTSHACRGNYTPTAFSVKHYCYNSCRHARCTYTHVPYQAY